jgi:hypothetical protein
VGDQVIKVRWLIAGLALVVAGWMAFDGFHALLTGDYVTPSSGRYAGQLGPWATLVAAFGIAPRSNGMIWFFAIYGSIWTTVIAAFVFHHTRFASMMLLCAVGSMWYLPFGTALGLVQILLLVVFRRRL